MDTAALVRAIDAALAHLETCADELRDLDAALGDGDLGVTVSAGSQAVRSALGELAAGIPPAQVLRVAAGAFARANPSTMAALVGGALLAGAKVVGDAPVVDRALGLAVGRAAAESIATRGRSQVGDKTILDALVPALDAMAASSGDVLAAGVAAAADGVERTRELQSQRGRASWLGERSKGRQDPGATAFLRFLEGWNAATGVAR
jgi:dihydroxyacetone kinase-like protein